MPRFANRLTFVVIPLVLVWCSDSAHAYCREYIEDNNSKFSYTFVCENSLASPPYLIVRQYVDDLEFELFELGFKDLRLLCSRARLDNGKLFGNCTRYGLRNLRASYDNGSYTIKTGGINQDDLSRLYESRSLYRYPEFVEQVPETGCAIVVAENRTIYWRFAPDRPEGLSDCLLNFERHATNEKWRF